jgi:predicted nucleic acid-binding protein
VTVAVVVSDTSPIRALAHLGLVDLLRDLFSEALIPPAVAAELQDPPTDSAPFDVSVIPFIRVQIPVDRVQVDQFLLSLDPGESEALALALEFRADLILIDEVAGRAAAQRLGLAPMGVLGMLVRAKQRGFIGEVKPLMDRLQDELNFFISPRLRAEVLNLAGEVS